MPPRKRPASEGDKGDSCDPEAGSSTSSGKKKQRVPKPEPEKRASRYISKPDSQVRQRIQRAYTHRLYLIDKVPVGNPSSPSACEFVVLGNTGNVYEVKLQEVPECTCPDFVRGHLCKHYLFVMLRVLKLSESDPRVWQKALLPSELSDILRQPDVADEVLASQSVIQRFQEITGKKVSGVVEVAAEEASKGIQRPVDGDCPVCYEPLLNTTKPKAEPVVFCKSCGNNVHRECFQKWSKTKRQGQVTCIYCRALWADDSKGTGSKGKGTAEGYVNLADYSQSHLDSEDTLQTLYPDTYEWIGRRR